MDFLRDYQKEAIEQLRNSLRQGNKRPILVAPTAFGKTILCGAIIKGAIAKHKSVLFLAPRRELIYQTVQEFEALGIHTSMIMAGEPLGYSMGRCKVASIDTLLSRAVRTNKMDLPKVDIIILDECHLMISKERKKLIDAYPKELIIGVTATPALPNNGSMGDVFDDLIITHDIKKLTEDGFLTPLRYFGGSCTDLAKIKINKDGDFQERSLGSAMDDPKLIGDIFENWSRIAPTKQTVIFCVSCAHAQHVYELFLRKGIKAEYIDGRTEKNERKDRLDRIATKESQVLVNCQIATYGLNIPCLECCVLARPTRSLVNFLQSVGRIIRLADGKEEAILIDHAGAIELHGRIDDPMPWSLDGETTVTERKEKAKKEEKTPKDVTCASCGYIFRQSRICPKCKYEMIPRHESIPFHQADLEEIKVKKEKYSEAYKQDFFEQMIGYARRNSKSDYWAINQYESRFKETPKWEKKGTEPGQEVANWIKHINIRNAYSKRKNAA
jgi:superfamily II DNA or RNA helicase